MPILLAIVQKLWPPLLDLDQSFASSLVSRFDLATALIQNDVANTFLCQDNNPAAGTCVCCIFLNHSRDIVSLLLNTLT
jgi:hypothetical protein